MADMTPDQAFQAALSQHMAGDMAEAEAIYKMILDAVPSHGPTLQALGVLYGQLGGYLASEELLAKASKVMPDSADVWSNLGNVLRILERHEESIKACQKAVALKPDHAFAWGNLAGVLRMDGRINEAKKAAETSLKLAPDYIEAKVNLGCCWQALGETQKATKLFEDLVFKNPDSLYGWSCLLMNQLYDHTVPLSEIAAASRKFGAKFPTPKRLPKPRRIEKVGFLSGDLCQHPVGLFMLPLIKNWDRGRHELQLFANLSDGDKVTKRLEKKAQVHFIQGIPDADVAAFMKEVGIDLLIDLSGHTAKNRIGLVAAAPAPYQAEWLGWSSTTGLKQVDFIIADEWCLPRGHEKAYTERPLRLPHSLFCLELCGHAIDPTPHKGLRIGSFNNPSKISSDCLTAWASLLKKLPEATLVLKYRGFSDQEVKAAFLKKLADLGIRPDRIELYGWLSQEDHWKLLSTLDLGLDTWPYTGATTTTDFLQAGVPIPTIAGDRYVGRMSASVLSAAGARSWITESVEEWQELMVNLAQDPKRRQNEGTSVRDGLASSTLCDGPKFAKDFQDLIDTIPELG
jgi:predicted O-linked N-acetylglucosamine transferase (SPINDLY family)